MSILIYALIYLGCALMVYNIIRFKGFIRKAKTIEAWSGGMGILYLPFVLLILFLAGYLLVGIFGSPDLIIAGILSGGSVFVFIMVNMIIHVVDRIRKGEEQLSARYQELRRNLEYLTQDSLAVFQVDLTRDRVEEMGGELYDSDRTAASFTEMMEARKDAVIFRLSEDQPAALFTRDGLMEQYQSGQRIASQVAFVRRPSGECAFVRMEVSLAQQPTTGDIIAFLTERLCNDDMVRDTILHKVLSKEYELVLSILQGRYTVAGGSGGKALPAQEGEYDAFLRHTVLPAVDPEEEDPAETEQAMSLERVHQALMEDETYHVNVTCRNGGETCYKSFIFYVVDRRADSYLMLQFDSTEARREQMERNEELKLALDRAEQANAAKSAFLFNMSHDIRTPMNAIIGYSALARKPGTEPERVRDFMAKIEQSGQRLLSLINDVLEMSRIESGRMELELEETSLSTLMEEVKDLFSLEMEQKGIAFTVETRDLTDPVVLCDSNRMNRVLLNLLSNAYKFTPPGGSVSAELTQTGRTGAREGAYVLRVRDTGIGMTEEFAARIFDAFERERTSTDSGMEGTGLGMSITKSILDLMGGTIQVDTAKDRGTTVTVRLTFPLAGADAEAETESDGGTFSAMRLLLVEDNDLNREIATLVLEEMGFAIDTVENGLQAVERMEASAPGDYAGVLMDIQMPVMDGYESTRSIRRLPDPALASVPIIAMSANASAEDVRKGMEAGMDEYIPKPLDPDKMKATLAKILVKR